MHTELESHSTQSLSIHIVLQNESVSTYYWSKQKKDKNYKKITSLFFLK